jgi:hypothetical protein
MRALVTILCAALAIASVAGEAEAQRRGRGRRGRTTTSESEPPPDTTSTTTSAPPPDPFAEEAPPTPPPPPTTTTTTATTTTGTGTGTGATTGTGTVAPGARVTQAGLGSGTPPPPPPAADPGPGAPDLAPIRQEYVAIMDEMVQARSRVAVLGQELFQTRMTITVQDRTGDEATLSRFVLELDGTPVHRTDGEIEGGDAGRQVFEGALAPGPHVLTVDLEQRARDDPEYRVTQRESFRFIVVRERLTEVVLILEDDSDIARSFRSGGEGHYEIRTRLRVATRELPRS